MESSSSDVIQNSFCSSHYGCELISRIYHYHHANFDKFSQDFDKFVNIIKTNILNLFKFSGGLGLAKTILYFKEYQEIIFEFLWKPFKHDISRFVGNVDGNFQYLLVFLESMPPQLNHENRSYLDTFAQSVSSFSKL